MADSEESKTSETTGGYNLFNKHFKLYKEPGKIESDERGLFNSKEY